MQLNRKNQKNNGVIMKKITTLTLTGLILFSSVSAEAKITKEKVLNYLKDYGIPCALSLGAGMVMAKDSQTGMAIGGAGCLGIGGATYLQQQREQKARELSAENLAQIKSMINESHTDRDKQVAEKMKALEEAQKVQLDELKSVLREVLAERMLMMETEMKEFLTQKLESGELMPKLEENLKAHLKKEVVSQVKAEQKGMVEKCVEETIKEVISKPIGVQENPTGVE